MFRILGNCCYILNIATEAKEKHFFMCLQPKEMTADYEDFSDQAKLHCISASQKLQSEVCGP